MDRRHWGIVLLAVVLVLAVLAPAWTGRRVPGSASMPTPPGPPRVGDCVHQVPSARSALDFVPPVMSGLTGPCTGRNVGEVVCVVKDVRSFPRRTENSMSQPQTLACDPLIRAYLGWPAVGLGDSGDAGRAQWRPSGAWTTGLLGPTMQQYFAGQRWLACLAFPRFGPFAGSLAGSIHTGLAADSFATCLVADGHPGAMFQSCLESHQIEILGWTTDIAPQGELAAACADLAGELTGMTDPTAGGVLTVQVRGTGDDPAVPPDAGPGSVDGRQSYAIAASGQRTLSDSLIGLGDSPLPWS